MSRYAIFDENGIASSNAWGDEEPSYGENWKLIPEDLEDIPLLRMKSGKIVAFTDSEIEEYHKENVTRAFYETLRIQTRNHLTATDWLVLRHTEQVSAGSSTSLSEAEYTALVNWRIALREASNSNVDPYEISLPEYPLSTRYPLPITPEIPLPEFNKKQYESLGPEVGG